VSPNVDTEARRAGTALRSHFAELPAPPLRGSISHPQRRVVIAAAAVVLVALVTVAVTRPWNPSPTIGSSSSRPIEAGPAWQRIQLSSSGIGPNRDIATVVGWHGRFVVAGDVFVPNSTGATPTTAAIWSSPDGLSWTPAALTDATAAHHVGVLVALPDRLVAIGGGAVDGENFVWQSSNGHTWQLVARGADLFGGSVGGVSGATAGGPGLIAWGQGTTAGVLRPAVWTSRDGRRWDPVLKTRSADHDGTVDTLTRTDAGWLAQGIVLNPERPAVWTSTSLTTWTRVGDHPNITDTPNPAGVRIGPTVQLKNNLLAVQNSSGGHNTLVQSRDGGRSWSPAPGPNGTVLNLVRARGYLVATGARATGPTSPPAAWTSLDARTWTPMPDLGAPPGGVLNLAATNGSTLVAFSGAPELDDYYRWVIGRAANQPTLTPCPGSISVNQTTSPDGLPSATSHTDDLANVQQILRSASTRIHHDYHHVSALTIGPGGGYVWDRAPDGTVIVRHVTNYAIYVYLKAVHDCPTDGRLYGSYNGIELRFFTTRR
jgi:hypothetical protein